MRRAFSCGYFLILALGLLLFPMRVLADSPYSCHRCTAPKRIDGRLNDWTEPYLTIDGWFWRPATGQQPVYGGVDDLSATMRLAWDKNDLYVQLSVLDDCFCPAKTGPVDTGDAVILTIAPAQAPKGTPVAPTEFAFTRRDITLAYQRQKDGTLVEAKGVKIGVARVSLPAPKAGIPHEAGKKAAATLTKLYYELAIPWALLPEITPCEGKTMGVGVQILDCDDGKTIRGSLKWRGGNGVSVTQTGYGQVVFALPLAAKPQRR